MIKATTIGFISFTHKYICEHEARPRNIEKYKKEK
jgi:hypothetical protein